MLLAWTADELDWKSKTGHKKTSKSLCILLLMQPVASLSSSTGTSSSGTPASSSPAGCRRGTPARSATRQSPLPLKPRSCPVTVFSSFSSPPNGTWPWNNKHNRQRLVTTHCCQYFSEKKRKSLHHPSPIGVNYITPNLWNSLYHPLIFLKPVKLSL